MIKLGKLTDYALLITNHLVNATPRLCTIDEIKNSTQIPLATNRKLLKKLVDAQIVRSVRGSKGGYQLYHDAEKISVADVIFAIEGPISITECATGSSECKISAQCDLRSNWFLINEFFIQNLRRISLKDMSLKDSIKHLNLVSIS